MIISIGSLKGGCGKSTIVSNLAMAFETKKMKTLVFDSDFGANNIDLYLDIDTNYTIEHFIKGDVLLKDTIIRKNEYIDVISGNSGTAETSNLSIDTVDKIIANLVEIGKSYDFVLIDTAPSLHHSVLNFCMASDKMIVVTNPDTPAMMDNYQLSKNVLLRGFSPENLYLIVNRADNERAAEITHSTINSVLNDNVDNGGIQYLGFFEESKSFRKAVAKRNQVYNENLYMRKKFNEMADKFINLTEKEEI